jgi:hypothetical protein
MVSGVTTTRTIAKNTKELKEIIQISSWKRHSFKADDPGEGMECDNEEILERVRKGRDAWDRCFIILNHPQRIVFQVSSTLWFTTGVDSLNQIREKVARQRKLESQQYWRGRREELPKDK